ncbi:tetratricopeptide repeat protein [Streptomyces jumonjinensis]|uniref:Tetratricopeptide repeat protein n=1 Tax=Streptomyces jumonjinensis TaxID=1945 RepID=A0A646KRA1_STRJU|nr:tetratricopeptide repeat protein [Streptomyces jumonjinensis]MQT04765.1 tetratricopeptide repeat protein [Streptomyces jumonjinensis]
MPFSTAMLDHRYERLAPDAQHTYRLLGALPGTVVIDADLTAAASALDWDSADSVLHTLAEHELVEPWASGARRRYRLASPGHARHQAGAHEPSDGQKAAVRRVCEWSVICSLVARQQLLPRRPLLARAATERCRVPFADDGAMRWLAGHRSTLRTMLWTATTNGWDELCWQLVHGLWPLLVDRRPVSLWAEATHLGLAAARRTGHGPAEREMLFYGATGLIAVGATEDALGWFTDLRQNARAAGDGHDEGRAAFGQALCHQEATRPDTATFCLDQAIALWQGCGNDDGVALASVIAGEIALADGDLPRATTLLTRALGLLPPPGTSFDAACALALLGRARLRTGHHEQGLAELHQALKAFEDTSETRWQARTLEYLACEASAHGHHDTAQHLLKQAAALYEPSHPGDEITRLLARLP